MDHFGYSGDIVVRGANKSAAPLAITQVFKWMAQNARNKILPGILFQYPYTSKPRLDTPKNRIPSRPLIIQLHQIHIQLEIIPQPRNCFLLAGFLFQTRFERISVQSFIEYHVWLLPETNNAIFEGESVLV
jgi:hypothetical protein